MLVGNKCDLESERKVSYDEGVAVVKFQDMGQFMETSAKDRSTLNELFLEISRA